MNNLTYEQVCEIINNASPPVYGFFTPWPYSKYIGLDSNNVICVYNGTDPIAPYTPTQEEKQEAEWGYGGDKPPRP